MIAPLYGIEKVARESGLSPEARKDRNRPALPFGWGRNGLDWWL
jgi:hypothetical protein